MQPRRELPPVTEPAITPILLLEVSVVVSDINAGKTSKTFKNPFKVAGT